MKADYSMYNGCSELILIMDFLAKDQEWTEIPGHRQYVTNETGVIYRLLGSTRTFGKPVKQQFHPVKGKEFPNGYYYVTLLSRDITVKGETADAPANTPIGVHTIVCRTFHGPKPTMAHEVNHGDGIKINNHKNNLEWTTRAENIQHSYDVLKRDTFAGDRHWLYGKEVSQETRRLQSEKKKGTLHPKFNGWYITPAGRFVSSYEAAVPNNTYARKIHRYCNDQSKLSAGWGFEPLDGPKIEENTVYQHYLALKRNGAFTNGKKEAHFDIYRRDQLGFKKKEHGGNIKLMPVSKIVGVTPLKNYPPAPCL